MSYSSNVIENIISRTSGESEFHQALSEVLPTLQVVLDRNPQFEEAGILERLVVPSRIVTFRVPWIDDSGKVIVNIGHRVQYSNAIGPFKGGLRFHPTVNLSILKFLAFDQIFKNSLTGLPIGSGVGGADFDPKSKSDNEVMRFCQSFMTELYRHVGQNTDILDGGGGLGVGMREVGYMYGQYKRITGLNESVFTGKGLQYGGSQVRIQATGYGLLYFVVEMLKNAGREIDGEIISISGSGNVAIYACEKAMQLGAHVVTMSDTSGFIYDKEGIDPEIVKEIKLHRRGSLSEYINYKKNAVYTKGKGVWSVPCDIALPCATQNELDVEDAAMLMRNGCYLIGEGANMPSTNQAIKLILKHQLLFAPSKAANAGGVAVSALEMSQNSARLSWSFDKVNKLLQDIMTSIYKQMSEAADEYGMKGNFLAGANIAGFLKVANAMLAQGVV